MAMEKNYGSFKRIAIGTSIAAFLMLMYPTHLNDRIDEGIYKAGTHEYKVTRTLNSIKRPDED
jgi:hypothetical protein